MSETLQVITEASPTTVSDLYETWWQSVKADLLIDREQFMVGARDWTLTPIHVDGTLAAMLINKGREVHFLKLGKHAILRSRLHAVIGPLLLQYKSLTTRTDMHDTASQAFIRRLGFNYIGAEGSDKFYSLEKLRHV